MPPSTTLAQEALRQLIVMIQEGHLQPGDTLTEAGVGAKIGMSRTPVRQAISQLRVMGLARSEGRFTRVKGLTAAEVEEIFFLRTELEVKGLRAALDLPSVELDRIEARLQWLNETPVVPSLEHRQADYELHSLLAGAGGNQRAATLASLLHQRTSAFDYNRLPQRFAEGQREHLAILAAIRARDVERAEAELRAHLTHARDAILADYAQYGAL